MIMVANVVRAFIQVCWSKFLEHWMMLYTDIHTDGQALYPEFLDHNDRSNSEVMKGLHRLLT